MSKFSIILLGVIVLFSGCKQKLSDTVAEVRKSVVHIEKVNELEGSGFVLTEDGLICTAKHVVEGGGEFIVTFDDGTKYTTKLSLYDSKYDVGFLKIEPKKPLKPLVLSKFNLRAGDPVFIMGSPLGFFNFNSVTLGIISAKQRDLDSLVNSGLGWHIVFQSDSAAYPGNSGGPVFNMDGQVVGILVAGVDASLNYSVPVELFIDKLEAIKIRFDSLRFGDPSQDKLIQDLLEQINYLEQEIQRIEQELNKSDPQTIPEITEMNPDDPEQPLYDGEDK